MALWSETGDAREPYHVSLTDGAFAMMMEELYARYRRMGDVSIRSSYIRITGEHLGPFRDRFVRLMVHAEGFNDPRMTWNRTISAVLGFQGWLRSRRIRDKCCIGEIYTRESWINLQPIGKVYLNIG